MKTITVNGIEFTGNPCRVVTGTFEGRYLKGGERLWAALFVLQAWLDKHHPGFYVYVVQSAYNTGVPASAGTHDFDGVIDVLIINRKNGRRVWLRGQRWMRRLGWAAWWRHTGSWFRPSSWHLHAILLGTISAGCPVGSLVKGQVDDYYGHDSGLAGHLPDPTWHPKDINATVFDFPAWLARHADAA